MTKGRDLDDKDLRKVSGGQNITPPKVPGADTKPTPPADNDGPSVPPFNAPTTGD